MAKAKKLPSGSYRVQVYAGKDGEGKRQYVSFTGATVRKAELAAMGWQEHYKEVNRDAASMTLTEAIDRYIQTKENILSPSTVAGYRQIQRNQMKLLMGMKLSKITQDSVQKTVNADAKATSPKSVRNAHGLLSAVLREYRPDFALRTTLPTKSKPSIHIPTTAEIPSIISAVSGKDIELPVLLGLMCGLRQSEIVGLRWDCYDGKRITIKRAVVMGPNGAVEKKPKSYAGGRTIVLPDCIVKLIDAQSKELPKIVPMTSSMIYKRFINAMSEAGIARIRFHDLRHANASVMLALNIPDKYAMERIGHTTNSTLKTVYQHTMKDERTKVEEKINDYFSKFVQHEMQHDNSTVLDSTVI